MTDTSTALDCADMDSDERRPVDDPRLVKRLQTPTGFEPPTELASGDVRAHPISRADLDDDVRGINASSELIRRTRGGGWPTEPATHDYNYVDLVWHECEFRDGKSFTFVLRTADGQYLGCCYLYPIGTRTPLSAELIGCDVDVSWWVTPEAYDSGYYPKVYTALQDWLTKAFPFWTPHYSNAEIPDVSAEGKPELGQYTVVGTIAAPRSRVFEVFSAPVLFAQWFEVPGYSTPAERVLIDPRAGGGVQALMVPNGGGMEIPFRISYAEYQPPGRVVLTFSEHTEILTIVLAELGTRRTRCTYHATGAPLTELAEVRRITANMHDRLAAALTSADRTV